jgi:hypothetical protein
MVGWTFAPWLIALLVAAGLGGLGWFTDRRARRRDQESDRDNG